MRRLPVATAAVALTLYGCSSSPSKADGSNPPISLATFQAADVVLGQADFTSTSPDRGGSVSAGGVRFPVGDAHFAAGVLVLPDTYNHRLLAYQGVPGTSGAGADTVLGQANGASAGPSHEPGRFHYPRSVGSQDAALIVADAAASRVQLGVGAEPWTLGWGEGAPAYRWGCAADRLSAPSRAIVAGGRLIVADRGNNRVLVWNKVPGGPAPADLVIGQRNLQHCVANDALGKGVSGGRTARTLQHPTDVWSDGERLAVVDQGNNRVLLWNRLPRESGTRADVVLGQLDFNVGAAATTEAGLNAPAAVASDGRTLFVADERNHRVLGWTPFPAASGQPANLVLGQSDFSHRAPNDDDQDGVTDGATARTLHHPTGLAVAGQFLVVTDTYNHRYLLYRGR